MREFHLTVSAVLAAVAAFFCIVSCDDSAGTRGGVENILLSRHKISLTEGATYSLTYEILPETAEVEESGIWTSSNPSVATVENGTVTAVSEGSADIVLELGGLTDMCAVTVSGMQLDSIVLNETSVRIEAGETVQLEATLRPSGVECDLMWTSDNSLIASVDESGTVTAVSEGLAVITVSAGEIYAKCNVVVEPSGVERVALNPTALELKVGEKSQIEVAVEPEEMAGSRMLWSSSNENVATVANGMVSALSAGSAVITVAVGDMSAECAVSVFNIEVESITLNYTEYTLSMDESVQLTAEVLPVDATMRNVSWSTSNHNVAVVDNTGKVTAAGSGEAVITASAGGMQAVCNITVESDVVWSIGDLYDVPGHDRGIVALVEDRYITIMHMVTGSAQWSTETVNTDLWDDFTGYGKTGTELLVEYAELHPGKYPAAEWCVSQGGDWYMPSETELLAIMNNHEAINAGMTANGGDAMVVESNARYWTCYEQDFSAQNSKSGYFTEFSWDPGKIYVTNGGCLKTETHYVILIQRIDL